MSVSKTFEKWASFCLQNLRVASGKNVMAFWVTAFETRQIYKGWLMDVILIEAFKQTEDVAWVEALKESKWNCWKEFKNQFIKRWFHKQK